VPVAGSAGINEARRGDRRSMVETVRNRTIRRVPGASAGMLTEGGPNPPLAGNLRSWLLADLSLTPAPTRPAASAPLRRGFFFDRPVGQHFELFVPLNRYAPAAKHYAVTGGKVVKQFA
jgi:hypothetical protein